MRDAPGVLIIRILPNIVTLLGFDPAWQQVARGAVLLAVVLLQRVVMPTVRIGGVRLRREKAPLARPASQQRAQMPSVNGPNAPAGTGRTACAISHPIRVSLDRHGLRFA